MDTSEGRRPLKTRQLAISQTLARWLAQKAISPNQISILSIVFSALCAICLILLPIASGTMKWVLPLLAATGIQLRLLCNLLDGMVAIEGGKKTASGELFNDIPDRIADLLIFVSAGLATDAFAGSSTLGWSAATLAILTAYIRVLAASMGAPISFKGPMAKQHRMALMTAVCVVSVFEPLLFEKRYAIYAGLVVVNIGCLLTLYNRTVSAYRYMENKAKNLTHEPEGGI